MTEIRELFRGNLRSLRRSKDLSQRELSEKCDYTRSYVGQLERGEKDPSFESLIRLANALELSILDFFRNNDEGLDVDLSEALDEMTTIFDNNIRSLTTIPEVLNWNYRMVSLLDPEGRFLDFNRSGFEFVSEEKTEIIGLPIWELGMFNSSRGHTRWLKKGVRVVCDEERICRGEFTVSPKSGNQTDIEITLTPITVVGSETCYIVAEGHKTEDIADRVSPENL